MIVWPWASGEGRKQKTNDKTAGQSYSAIGRTNILVQLYHNLVTVERKPVVCRIKCCSS